MRRIEKNLSFDDENQQFKQTSRTGPKHLKFQRLKKQSATLPLHYNINQPCQTTNRKYVYDQQAMNDIILALKEQNNQLKNLIKIQQTQINYFQQQERSLITNTINKSNSSGKGQSTPAPVSHLKKLQLQNFRLKKQVQKLEEQNGKIKKTVKQTSIKQLETQIYVYEQEIKNLTAKLTGYKKSNTNISQINKIIQKEYYSGLKIKELQNIIDNKTIQLQQSAKVIRKLKNIVNQKNSQIESFKEQREKIQNIIAKSKSNDQYVPKSELITKKKQLLAMTETIQKLQSKLIECQSKAQALQQENIDNMNRQTNKRKQILVQFQKLKKNHEYLQQALAMSLKKNNDVLTPLRLTKVPDRENSFGKQRVPQVVRIQQIKEPTQIIIHNLQKNYIDHRAALNLLKNNSSNSESLYNSQKLDEDEQKINIRQIIHCLEEYPICLENYQHKELVARYLVESESDCSETINYDSFVNISYARSVFKLLLHQYPLFSEEDISNNCYIVQDFLKRNEHPIKATLYKIQQQKSDTCTNKKEINQIENSNMSLNGSCKMTKNKKGSHKLQDYIQSMVRENELTEEVMKFIKYWTFTQRDQYLTYPQLAEYFKREGVNRVCTFITQDPDNYECIQQKNQKSIEKENKNRIMDNQTNNIN